MESASANPDSYNLLALLKLPQQPYVPTAGNIINGECRYPPLGVSGGEGLLKKWGAGGVNYGPSAAFPSSGHLTAGVGSDGFIPGLCYWVINSIVSLRACRLRPQRAHG